MEKIGERLKRLMKERGWKRPRLKTELKARDVDVTVETIRQIEIGKIKQPRPDVQKGLALVFGLSEAEMVFGGKPRPDGHPDDLPERTLTAKELKIISLVCALNPAQQEELLPPLRAAFDANKVTQKHLRNSMRMADIAKVEDFAKASKRKTAKSGVPSKAKSAGRDPSAPLDDYPDAPE